MLQIVITSCDGNHYSSRWSEVISVLLLAITSHDQSIPTPFSDSGTTAQWGSQTFSDGRAHYSYIVTRFHL